MASIIRKWAALIWQVKCISSTLNPTDQYDGNEYSLLFLTLCLLSSLQQKDFSSLGSITQHIMQVDCQFSDNKQCCLQYED